MIFNRGDMVDNNNPFQTLQDDVFNLEHKPVTSIYADMELLQDLKFGALLTFVEVEEEMRYIYSQLDQYNNKVNTHMAEYFPVMGITDDDIAERMGDPEHMFKICGIAPFTAAYDDFLAFLFASIRHNKILGKQQVIDVVVNISDIKYPALLFDKFKENISVMAPGVSFRMSNHSRYTQAVLDFTKFDSFFLYEFHKLLSEGSGMAMAFAQNGSFFGKSVFTPPYIDTEMHQDSKEYDKVLVSTEYGLNIYCDFKYTSTAIPTPEVSHG